MNGNKRFKKEKQAIVQIDNKINETSDLAFREILLNEDVKTVHEFVKALKSRHIQFDESVKNIELIQYIIEKRLTEEIEKLYIKDADHEPTSKN